MRINIIEDIENFKGLENSWDDLCSRTESETVFESFEFNYYSWVYCLANNKNNLALVLVYDDHSLQVICPFYIDSRRRVRFINDNHSDSCDIISNINLDIDIILKEVYRYFSINSFHFINLKSKACILKSLSLSFDYYIDRSSAVYSVLDVSKGVFPENVSEYRSRQKTEFRRILKKNQNREHKILSYKECKFPYDSICSLRSNMISRGVRSDNFLPSNQLKLIERLYRYGKVILSVVENKDTVNAISVIMKHRDRYLIWIDLYDNAKMINLFNYIYLISLLSSNQSIHINFGRGDYFYKTSNFLTKKIELSSLHIFSSNKYKIMYYIESFLLNIFSTIYNIFKK